MDCFVKGQGQKACWDKEEEIRMERFLSVNFGASQPGSRLSFYQIVEVISQQIQSDSALQGCRLPPIRVLAHQLGVSKNTISAAYEELKAKGLVESRGRIGLFVSLGWDSFSRQFKGQSSGQVPLPVLKQKPSLRLSLGSQEKFLLLSSVFIDPSLAPKERLANCFRSALKSPGLSRGTDPQGFLPLRKKIAERLQKRGIAAQPQQIMTTVGSQQVLDLLCRSMQSKVIATESPAYDLGKALMEMNEMVSVGLPVDPFKGVNLIQWEKMIRESKPGLIYLTSNFQNPTGYSYSSREMTQVVEWSQTYGFGILEDDWGSDMLSYSEFKPSLRALGGDNVLYMNSFTKKLLPSLRLGYVVGNEESISALVRSKSLTVSSAPPIIEAALFEFLDRGYYDAHLKKVQQELDARYQNCLELLRNSMPQDVRWTSPGGGPVLWLELPKSIDLEQLVLRLKEEGVIVRCSHDAFFGTPHLHGFKIGYAFLSIQEMQIAIGKLSQVLK